MTYGHRPIIAEEGGVYRLLRYYLNYTKLVHILTLILYEDNS